MHAEATSEHQVSLVGPLLGLTLVTGLIDAVSFLGLGHVFTANMTGNVVFLGFALGGAADLSVSRSLAALAAFGAGGVFGGRLNNGVARTPVRHLLIALCAEALVLAVAGAAASPAGHNLSVGIVYTVIVLTGTAMGLRNAVVRKLAVPDMTTTVLTLTVTGLAADSSLAGGTSPRLERRVLSVLTMAVGALIGAILLRQFGVRAPLLTASLAVTGLIVHLWLADRRSRLSRDS
jgi:uncharacterized membrane protein YoaK (UPF0700 family)